MKRKTMMKLVLLVATALCGTYCSQSEEEKTTEKKPESKKTEEAKKDEKPSQAQSNTSPERPAPAATNPTPAAAPASVAPAPATPVPETSAPVIPNPIFLTECADPNHSLLMNELRILAGAEDCREIFQNLFSTPSLRLASKDLVEISPLRFFTNLKRLSLDENQINDVSSLAQLTKLEYLSLQSNDISDVSALASLPGLKAVRLEGNSIIDLAPLTRIATLELAALQTGVRDFPALQGRTQSEERVDLRYGAGVCSGGWEYDEYRECRHPNFGVDRYYLRTGAVCGERSREPVYRSCRHPDNGYSNNFRRIRQARANFQGDSDAELRSKCNDWHNNLRAGLERHQQTSGYTKTITRRPQWLEHFTFPGSIDCYADVDERLANEGRTAACRVERYEIIYNTCRHPSFGVEEFNIRRAELCGRSGVKKYTPPMSTHDSAAALGEVLGCATCENKLVAPPHNPAEKFECIDQQLKKNISELVNNELVSISKLIYRVFPTRLTSDQIDFIQWLDDRYPDVGYPNNRSL